MLNGNHSQLGSVICSTALICDGHHGCQSYSHPGPQGQATHPASIPG